MAGEWVVYTWLAFLFTVLFVMGCTVGSFLNVVIGRLPVGKNLLRPPSHCGRCGYQIAYRDNLPLISYWRLKGRCRRCAAPFSMRYFWIELLTGLGFAALYFLEIGWKTTSYYPPFGGFWYLTWGVFPPNSWLVFLYHAPLLCFLIVAAGCGAEHEFIPRRLTLYAFVIGLVGSSLMPWPWPNTTGAAVRPGAHDDHLRNDIDPPGAPGAMPLARAWSDLPRRPHSGVQLWPVWGPPPAWLPSGGMLLGVTTGLVGAVAGLILSRGLLSPLASGRKERPLGAGEADFLAGAGAFLGWQPLAVAAALAFPIVGTTVLLVRLLKGRRRTLLSPVLAATLVLTWFCWTWVGRLAQPILLDGSRVLMTAFCLVAAVPFAIVQQKLVAFSESTSANSKVSLQAGEPACGEVSAIKLQPPPSREEPC